MSNRIGMTIVIAVLLGSTAINSPAVKNGEESAEFQRNLDRWLKMEETERTEVRGRFEEWKTLEPEQRTEIRDNFRRFHKFDPDEQKSLSTSHRSWIDKLESNKREMLRRKMTRYSRLRPDQRRAAMAVGNILHEADDEVHKRFAEKRDQDRRRVLLALRDFFRELPPHLKARLESMPPGQRKMAIRRIMHERNKGLESIWQNSLKLGPDRQMMKTMRELMNDESVRRIIGQLRKEEKMMLGKVPPRMRIKVLTRLRDDPSTDERKVQMLKKMIRGWMKRGRGEGPRRGDGPRRRPPQKQE